MDSDERSALEQELRQREYQHSQLQTKYDALKEQYQRLALATETSSELVANKLFQQIRRVEREKEAAENQERQVEEKLQETLQKSVLSHQQFEAEHESISLQLQRKIQEEKRQRQELEERLQKVELDLVATDHIREMMNLIKEISYDTKYVSDDEVEEIGGEPKARFVLVELNKAIHRLLEKNKSLQDENSVLTNRVKGLNDELYIVHEKSETLRHKMQEHVKQNVDANLLLEVGHEQKFNEQKRLSRTSLSRTSSVVSESSMSSNPSLSGASSSIVSDSLLAENRARQLFDSTASKAAHSSPLLTAQTLEPKSREDIAFETLSLDSTANSVASLSST